MAEASGFSSQFGKGIKIPYKLCGREPPKVLTVWMRARIIYKNRQNKEIKK